MTRSAMGRRILQFEMVGFILCALLMSLDELGSFFFSSPVAKGVDWLDLLYDNLMMVALAVVVMWLTRRVVQQLQYLEGFLPVCSFCRQIRVDGEWISLEQYLDSHSEMKVSHGVCPACASEHYGEYLQA